MGIESTRFLPRHLRRDHWANPRLAARPHGRRRPTHRPPPIPSSRRRTNHPAAGSGRCSGPLSVTSPDFPAYLRRRAWVARHDAPLRTAGQGLGSNHRRRVGPRDGHPHDEPLSPPTTFFTTTLRYSSTAIDTTLLDPP